VKSAGLPARILMG